MRSCQRDEEGTDSQRTAPKQASRKDDGGHTAVWGTRTGIRDFERCESSVIKTLQLVIVVKLNTGRTVRQLIGGIRRRDIGGLYGL